MVVLSGPVWGSSLPPARNCVQNSSDIRESQDRVIKLLGTVGLSPVDRVATLMTLKSSSVIKCAVTQMLKTMKQRLRSCN